MLAPPFSWGFGVLKTWKSNNRLVGPVPGWCLTGGGPCSSSSKGSHPLGYARSLFWTHWLPINSEFTHWKSLKPWVWLANSSLGDGLQIYFTHMNRSFSKQSPPWPFWLPWHQPQRQRPRPPLDPRPPWWCQRCSGTSKPPRRDPHRTGDGKDWSTTTWAK